MKGSYSTGSVLRIVGKASATITGLIAALLLLPGGADDDHLIITPQPRSTVMVLVRGGSTTPLPRNTFSYEPTTDEHTGIALPNLQGAGGVALFPTDPSQTMTYKAVIDWLPHSKTVTATLPARTVVNLIIWILYTPSGPGGDTMVTKASNDVIASQALYDQEHMGLELHVVKIIHTSDILNASSFLDFRCGSPVATPKYPDRKNVEENVRDADGAKRPNCINVYYFRKVTDKYGTLQMDVGNTCDYCHDFIAIGYKSKPHVLAHEIGHALSLGHAEESSLPLERDNIMEHASDTRKYFSEGQIFRAHLHYCSMLNQPGYSTAHRQRVDLFPPTDTNIPDDGDAIVPPINLYLWNDPARERRRAGH